MSPAPEHAKAWAALIMAILVIIENYLGLSFGPVTSNGVTDIIVIAGAAAVWLLPDKRGVQHDNLRR